MIVNGLISGAPAPPPPAVFYFAVAMPSAYSLRRRLINAAFTSFRKVVLFSGLPVLFSVYSPVAPCSLAHLLL